MVLPGHPTPSANDLRVTGQANTPLFPPHDPALQTLYAATMPVSAAWRPDGNELATVSFHVTNSGTTLTASLNVWDCTTGKELRSLSVFAGGMTSVIAEGVPGETLRWSPEGSDLLFFDPSLSGQVTIWHVS
jgi:Tol biopolymer transport system component